MITASDLNKVLEDVNIILEKLDSRIKTLEGQVAILEMPTFPKQIGTTISTTAKGTLDKAK